MSDKPEDITAFPVNNHAELLSEGMTLRDYFAGKALNGIYSSATAPLKTRKEDSFADAKLAYQVADEMLKARQS